MSHFSLSNGHSSLDGAGNTCINITSLADRHTNLCPTLSCFLGFKVVGFFFVCVFFYIMPVTINVKLHDASHQHISKLFGFLFSWDEHRYVYIFNNNWSLVRS